MDLPAYESIKVAVDGGVGTVTIDRPPRNALVPTTMLEIRDAMWRLDENPAVRAVVLTGAGKFFCSGADLTRRSFLDPKTGRVDRNEIKRLRDEHRRKLGLRNKDLPELRVPVIAAINGPAAGGGLTLSLCADIRLIAEDARIAFAFTRLGLGPEHGITWILPRIVGLSVAMDLLVTGRSFDGAEAARIGLVSRALPAAEVLPAALEMAKGIAEKCSPLAVAVMKQMTWAHAAAPSYVDATRNEQSVIEWITQQPDAKEGFGAFLEKRPVAWQTTGREAMPSFMATLFAQVVDEY